MNRYCAMCVFTIVLLPLTILAQQSPLVPPYVNYQGTLADSTGKPIANGTYAVSFTLFDAPNEGKALWGPQQFDGVEGSGHGQKVVVANGFFNVLLGPTDTQSRSILDAFSSQSVYMELAVDGKTIVPRFAVLSSPFAVQAGNGVPPGSVMAYFGSVAPPGWLICNGGDVPDGRVFDNLRQLVGAKLPDLRGRVIVGAGQGEGLTSRDINKPFGEERHRLTFAEMPSHFHNTQGTTGGQVSHSCCIGQRALPATDGEDHTHAFNLNSGGPQAINNGEGAPHNIMPPSLGLTYIIKY